MTKHSDQRFYREGRKVMDREPVSRSPVYCTARSNHAAEMIQHALNNWIALGPSKTPKMTGKDYAQLRRTNKAVHIERERCAKIAEIIPESEFDLDHEPALTETQIRRGIAAAIKQESTDVTKSD